MSRYQPGELVDITVRARVDRQRTDGDGETALDVTIEIPDTTGFGLTVPLVDKLVSVERVAPVEWPPQLGDVWATDSQWGELLWMAALDAEGALRMVPADGRKGYPYPTWPANLLIDGPVRLRYRPSRAEQTCLGGC